MKNPAKWRFNSSVAETVQASFSLTANVMGLFVPYFMFFGMLLCVACVTGDALRAFDHREVLVSHFWRFVTALAQMLTSGFVAAVILWIVILGYLLVPHVGRLIIACAKMIGEGPRAPL